MKHFTSFFFVMLMSIGMTMAETYNVTATYASENHDTLGNGYQVVLNEDTTAFIFEIDGVSALTPGYQYRLSDMLTDSTFACRFVRIEAGLRVDTISYADCWLTKDNNGNFTALVVTATDSFLISYTKPLSVVQLELKHNSGYADGNFETKHAFQITAMDSVRKKSNAILVITILGASQYDGTYFTSNVYAEDTVKKYIFTALDVKTEGGDKVVHFRALAPNATITTVGDKLVGVVGFLGADSVLYDINFECNKEKPSSVDNVITSSCIAYSQEGAIVLAGAADLTATIYDMSGRIICTRQVTSDFERIEVAAKGVYFIHVNNQTLRVIIR